MQQFICSKCKEKFHYPAKLGLLTVSIIFQSPNTTTDNIYQGNTKTATENFEVQVCPFCKSLTFTEYVEPEADITSVLSCDLGAVDGFLKQGYIVKELYAKTATLILKVKPKVVQPDPDDNQAITETPDQQQIKVNKAYLAKKADQP
jgi:hypothetical protein